MIMNPDQRLTDVDSLRREDVPSTKYDLISDEFIHWIDELCCCFYPVAPTVTDIKLYSSLSPFSKICSVLS